MTLENDWDTVKEFIDDLGGAITEDKSSIKETELGVQAGKTCQGTLWLEDGQCIGPVSLFVDKFGRVSLPPEFETLKSVSFDGVTRDVVNKETRYSGDELVAWVFYLEAQS